MSKYTEFINSNIDKCERKNYSFTCSSKGIEERAIIAYLEYLKDNNISYGKMLKDILYNSSINQFELSLPKKNVITIGNNSRNNTIDDEAIKEVLLNTNKILEEMKEQERELQSLRKIIEIQNETINRLKMNNNKYNDETVDKEIEEKKMKFKGQTTSKLFGGI